MKTRAPAPAAEWDRRVRSAMVQVASLVHRSLTVTRSWCADSPLQRVRLAAKLERAETELAQAQEEMRIKDSRMEALSPHRRPLYSPSERLAILALKAARGWNLNQTAKAFMVEPDTVAEWLKRVAEPDDNPLVDLPQPANKYPDFVRQVVQRLKTLCPLMGKRRIADTLAKAGLRLAATTVKRMLNAKPPPPKGRMDRAAAAADTTPGRVVTARHTDHVWHVDLTVVPTCTGFWTAWFPFSVVQVWPFCWWVSVVVDHFSRGIAGFAVFKRQPTSEEVRLFLSRAISRRKAKPAHIITDRGPQFDCGGYRAWARRRKIKIRYGAVGRYGSIAIVERFIRSMKSECFAHCLVPFSLSEMRCELDCYAAWFNEHRPHQGLGGRTPTVNGGRKVWRAAAQ